MRKFLISLLVIVVLLLLTGYTFREPLFFALMASQIGPDHDFDESLAPGPPDYDSSAHWAARPDKDDPADQIPASFTRNATGVPVFFIHPTTYMSPDNWNQPLDEESANWIVDQRVLRHQASVFNSCCDVFAPRYRQATFFSFIENGKNGGRALDLAYQDVDRAFDHFLSQMDAGQPFILAGHSQGTRHAAQLLADRIATTPLLERMVAAYLVGFSVSQEQLGGVALCEHPTQINCAMGWNAVDGAGAGIFGDVEGLVCTNPLTWRSDGGYAGHEMNLGGIGYPAYGPADDGEDYTAMPVVPAVADAQCVNGQLTVAELRSDAFPSRMPGNSMHVFDYSLFHGNIRSNVAGRVAAYLGQKGYLLD